MGIFEKREWNSTPPVSLLILIWEDFLGEGRETERSVFRATNGVAKGHPERPLAEVFSQMPRCAPLRLL